MAASILFFTANSHAQQWLDLQVNDFRFNGQKFSFVKIEINPAYRNVGVPTDEIERLKFGQHQQQKYLEVESFLMNLQHYVADNQVVHGRVNESGKPNSYVEGLAFKHSDPTGEFEIMSSAGNIPTQTKVDELFTRHCLILSVCRDGNLMDPIATVKMVVTEPSRVNKDLTSEIPEAWFRNLMDVIKTQQIENNELDIEVENLSTSSRKVPGEPSYNFLPFLAKQIHASRFIEQQIEAGKKVTLKLNALEGLLPLYMGLGFQKFNFLKPHPREPLVYYMKMNGADFWPRARAFFSIKNADEYFQLPWVVEGTWHWDYHWREEARYTRLYIISQLKKIAFDPDPATFQPRDFSCPWIYRGRFSAQKP